MVKKMKSEAYAKKRWPSSTYGVAHFKRGSDTPMTFFGPDYKSASDQQKINRKETGWTGKGKYTFSDFEHTADRFLKKGIPNILKAAGQVKGFFGRGLYGGQGAYTDNQLIEGGLPAQSVMAANDETDTITISDREFVKDIFAPSIASGSSSFAQQQIPVNAGLPQFAPNLSQLACNYTEYELIQLVYELVPVISESNVNNGQTGTAMMVFNYNPNEDPYDNKEDVMQAHGSVSGRIVDCLRAGVECDPNKTNKTEFFVRTGPVPYGKDSDEYDMGVLTIATNNIPAAFSNTQLFELYVSYTVQLRKRRAGAMRLLNQQRDLFVSFRNHSGPGDCWGAGDFVSGSDGVLVAQQSNIGTVLSSSANKTAVITFPADFNGFVEIKANIEGTSLAGTNGISGTASGNVSTVADILTALGTAGDTPLASEAILATYGCHYRGHFKVRSSTGGVENKITLVHDLTSANITGWSVEISELSPAMWSSRSQPKPLLLNQKDLTLVTY